MKKLLIIWRKNDIFTEAGGELKFLSGKLVDFSKHEKGQLPDFVVAAHSSVIDELRHCFSK